GSRPASVFAETSKTRMPGRTDCPLRWAAASLSGDEDEVEELLLERRIRCRPDIDGTALEEVDPGQPEQTVQRSEFAHRHCGRLSGRALSLYLGCCRLCSAARQAAPPGQRQHLQAAPAERLRGVFVPLRPS